METTERIVEAYARYIKGCATIPNIRCAGQNEIDLLAINPATLERYHIETSVSISRKFSRLTETAFDPDLLKQRVHVAAQRRTIGYFLERKFVAPGVLQALAQYEFREGNYTKVIVFWDWTTGAADIAAAHGVELWSFPALMRGIVDASRGTRHYFTDDTMRTLHLFDLMAKDRQER
jgi:hypothetical protein